MSKEFYCAHCQKHLSMAAYAGDRNGKHQCLACKARVDLHMQGVKTAKLDLKKVKSVNRASIESLAKKHKRELKERRDQLLHERELRMINECVVG